MWPVVDRNALVPGQKILEQARGHGFRQPIGNEQRKIEVAVAQSAVGDGRRVKIVNSDGNQLNVDAGVMCLKKPRLFSQRIFKIRVIAKRNAKCDHAASVRMTKAAAETCDAQFMEETIAFKSADAV